MTLQKSIQGCEIARDYYIAKEYSESQVPKTQEQKIFSLLCSGITKAVLTTLSAYGREGLEADGVCFSGSAEDVELGGFLDVVLAQMRQRLDAEDEDIQYDATFLITTAALDAVHEQFACGSNNGG